MLNIPQHVLAFLQTVSIADKRALAANFLKTAKIMVPPTLYYGAIGVAFSGTQCAVEKINGERDAVSGILGGVAAGAVVGLRNGSLPGAIGFGMLFAGGQRRLCSALRFVLVPAC